MGALSRQLQGLQRIAGDAKRALEDEQQKWQSGSQAWNQASILYANHQVQRAAAGIFIKKYASAGIVTKTGKLLLAISQPSVVLQGGGDRLGTSKSKISVAWRAGIPGKKDAKKPEEKSVYVYGSAINFGSVRQPRHVQPYVDPVDPSKTRYMKRGLIGRKLAKSLKRKAFGGKANQRTEQYIERTRRLSKRGVSQYGVQMTRKKYYDKIINRTRHTVTFDIKSAGVSITTAKNFFTLTAAEQAFLSSLWTVAFTRKFSQLSGAKVRTA